MRYQDCAQALQADAGLGAPPDAAMLADANINAATGLATDYLNHFNEAIMLLEMLPGCPDCRADLLAWQPKSYRAHFASSAFKGRAVAIAAYETADPRARAALDALAGTMTAVLEATRAALAGDMPEDAAGALAERSAACLKPLIARAGAVINGNDDGGASPAPQAIVDGLMK
jgi:hypothetical protein